MLKGVLLKAWDQPFTTQSDFARANAQYVAIAASEGLITVAIGRNCYSPHWHVTKKGLEYLEQRSAATD